MTNFAYSGSTITGTTDYFATHDANGNMTALINSSTGAVAQAYEYSPFGEVITSTNNDGTVADNPMGFADKFTDSETGLVYYGHRYYSPVLGRFINRDPAEEGGGVNLYGFCGNDSVNGADVLGLYPAAYGANYTPPALVRPPAIAAGGGGNFNLSNQYQGLDSIQDEMAAVSLGADLLDVGGLDAFGVMMALQSRTITPTQAAEYLGYNLDTANTLPSGMILGMLQAGPTAYEAAIDMTQRTNDFDSMMDSVKGSLTGRGAFVSIGAIYQVPEVNTGGGSFGASGDFNGGVTSTFIAPNNFKIIGGTLGGTLALPSPYLLLGGGVTASLGGNVISNGTISGTNFRF